MMKIRTWFRPEPQPQQFIGTAVAGVSLIGVAIKVAIIAIPVGYLAFQAGDALGERRGRKDAFAEVKAVTDEKNRRITELNEELDAAHTLAEGKREDASGKVLKSLSEFSPKLRQECSTKCSMPASARANLEAIDP